MLSDDLAADPRVTVVSSSDVDTDRGRCVVYWMQRAQRALDNPALETAIDAANRLGLPVAVVFVILGRHPNANLRHYSFMFDGLADTAKRLADRGVGFIPRVSAGSSPIGELARLFAELRPALVVMDENPLRASRRWRSEAARLAGAPSIVVDADVIVPSAIIGREHYAARTIRRPITSRLGEFMIPIRQADVRRRWRLAIESVVPTAESLAGLKIDRTAQPVANIIGGTTAGLGALARFVTGHLDGYAKNRNRPELEDGTSRLSPYLHFGHLSPITIALAVRDASAPEPDRSTFLEELIVRRELAINYVRYNQNYDRIAGCEPWARRTLGDHRGDPRAHLYNDRQFENAETHDELWNAAQRQMVVSGRMHGYMRMYWAKKILEWSADPEAAFAVAVRLNDRYELDGRDPNGYAGIAWAIGGKHDRAWGPRRPVYGMIRYMSAASTGRKFNSRVYMDRWNGGAAPAVGNPSR